MATKQYPLCTFNTFMYFNIQEMKKLFREKSSKKEDKKTYQKTKIKGTKSKLASHKYLIPL